MYILKNIASGKFLVAEITGNGAGSEIRTAVILVQLFTFT